MVSEHLGKLGEQVIFVNDNLLLRKVFEVAEIRQVV